MSHGHYLRFLFSWALVSGVAFAQSGSGQGAVQGHVTDPAGNFVPAAEVTLRSTGTGLIRKARHRRRGPILSCGAAGGTYVLEAAASGFGIAREPGVDVVVGETRTVNIGLQLASTSTQITIVESAQIVNETEVSNWDFPQ